MAARFLVGGGNGNWTSTTNWSATDGGASGASAPTASDDVTMNTNSGATNITTDTSARACLSLTITSGYTGTITMTNTLTVSGAITLNTAFTFAGASALIQSAGTISITTNAKTINIPFTITSSTTRTITLADTLNVSGLLTLTGSSGATVTVNSNGIAASGGLTTSGTVVFAGSSTLTLSGTNALTGGTGCTLRLNTTFNSAGTITVSGTLVFNTGTLTYTAGTITTTGSTLQLGGAATTIATNGMSWDAITLTGGISFTLTLTNNLTATGTVTLNPTGGATYTLTSNTINVGGSLIPGGSASGTVSGTTAFNLNGTGTWSGVGLTQKNNVTINTSGTITISGVITYNTGTITYTAGTIVYTSSSFTISANTTFDLNGATIGGINMITAGVTVTLNSAAIVAEAVTLVGTLGSTAKLKSNSGGTQRSFKVLVGCLLGIIYCDPTDIDSTGGPEIRRAGGTLSNTLNWSTYPFPAAGIQQGLKSYTGG